MEGRWGNFRQFFINIHRFLHFQIPKIYSISDTQYNLRRDAIYTINITQCPYPSIFVGVVHTNIDYAHISINGMGCEQGLGRGKLNKHQTFKVRPFRYLVGRL